MSFITTILTALGLRAGDVPVETEPSLVYRSRLDMKTHWRSSSDTETVFSARIDLDITHRTVVEAV